MSLVTGWNSLKPDDYIIWGWKKLLHSSKPHFHYKGQT